MKETRGERLKRLRHMRGLTQREVCQKLGHSSVTVLSRFEGDNSENMQYSTARQLAGVYGVTTEYILHGEDDDLSFYPRDVRDYLVDPANVEDVNLFVYGKIFEKRKNENKE